MDHHTFTIHPNTRLGPVVLATADLQRQADFYQHLMGLQVLASSITSMVFGVGKQALLALVKQKPGQPLDDARRRTAGLYHLAFLVPNRASLANALSRLVLERWPLQGSADHGVSEAIYLADADGNGIEIYRDLPRAQWPFRDGRLQMKTAFFDMDRLMTEADPGIKPAGMPPETRMGHVHLQVTDVTQTERFYSQVLGFDLVQKFGHAAGFVSAGGYHHHIGFNSWDMEGAQPATSEVMGLRCFSIQLPHPQALRMLVDHLLTLGYSLEARTSGWLLRDPDQIGIYLTTSDLETRLAGDGIDFCS